MPELHGNIQHKSVMHNEVNMEQYVVEGGNPLVGEVEIGGAKNAALAILAASVMTDETVLIENMPDVRDTNILLQAMQSIGVIVERVDRHTVKVNASHIHELVIEDDFIKKIRRFFLSPGSPLGKIQQSRGGASRRLQYRKPSH